MTFASTLTVLNISHDRLTKIVTWSLFFFFFFLFWSLSYWALTDTHTHTHSLSLSLSLSVLMHINEVKRPTVERRQWSMRMAGCEHKAVDSGEAVAGAARTLQLHVETTHYRFTSAGRDLLMCPNASSWWFLASFRVSEGLCWLRNRLLTQHGGLCETVFSHF